MKKITLVLSLILGVSSAIAATLKTDELPQLTGIAKHTNKTTQYVAATNGGLFKSHDGVNWESAFKPALPATLVTETSHGELYTFILSKGLLKYNDTNQQWQLVNNQFGSQILIDLSGDASDPNRLVALNQFRKLIVSNNGGKDWHSIKGQYKAKSEQEQRGQALYEDKCQTCHGIDGVGETYTLQALTDKTYLRAPALNDSEHAWHHTDDALTKTILEGSSRASRMPAWKDKGLTEGNARDLVAYIKSLWTQRELDCQGPKHMQCM